MAVSLPQKDNNKQKRAKELLEARQGVDYDFSVVENVPLATTIPEDAQPDLAWQMKIVAGSYKTRRNWEKLHDKFDLVYEEPMPYKSVSELAKMLSNKDLLEIMAYCDPDQGKFLSENRPKSFDEYFKFFLHFDAPEGCREYQCDKAFADYFTAGLNPVMIEALTKIPSKLILDESCFASHSAFADDNLQAAMNDGRVFYVDYKAMLDLEPGEYEGRQKHVYAPIVVLALPKGKDNLEVVGIQLGQSGDQQIMVTPAMGKWDWLVAKTMVKVTDANYHELVSHLAYTHLIAEPIAIASFRQFSRNHPLYELLIPHFVGTLPINRLATRVLINKGGTVETLLTFKIESAYKLIENVRTQYKFREQFPKNDCERRGTGTKSKLKNYPYRDDAILIWDAIQTWVEAYVDTFYQSDRDVQEDHELAAWVDEIQSPKAGSINDFTLTGSLDSRKELVEILTMTIFTASAQHAAMNFPQGRSAAVPYQPLSAFAPVPTQLGLSEEDALEFLPPVNLAIDQTHTMNFLGNTHHTQLGGYPLGTFSDKSIVPALWKFQYRLNRIESEIDSRNEGRRLPYPFLKPSMIPQSINI